jgi:hypothetical protein
LKNLTNPISFFLILLVALVIIPLGLADTGGTITTDGSYTIHTFTTNDTYIVTSTKNITILVVAGGGSGGGKRIGNDPGGGGAGGLIYNNSYLLATGSYNIIIGRGGIGTATYGENGINSSFNGTLNANGGGAGGASSNGSIGGSGGGGSGDAYTGASGTAGQGNAGGNATGATGNAGGGGGGAGGYGSNGAGAGPPYVGGAGGACLNYSINGSNTNYSAGGGGTGFTTGGLGACGIGGNGVSGTSGYGGNAIGYGSGGGGAGRVTIGIGGNGSQGIIIIRYLTSTSGITFINQIPIDINTSNIFSSRLNITYQFNTTNLLTYGISLKTTSPTKNCIVYINKSCRIINDTYINYTLTNSTLTGDLSLKYKVFNENDYVPGTFLLSESSVQAYTPTITTLNGINELAIIKMYNVSNLSNQFNFIELGLNTSGTCNIYVSNETSETLTNLITNNKAVLIGSLNSGSYHHNHSNEHKDNIFNMPVINGKINNITPINDNSEVFIIIKPNSALDNCYIQTVNNLTVTSGDIKSSNNAGVTYTNQTYYLRSHIHQIDQVILSKITYLAWANYTTGYENTSELSDNFDINRLPPTSPGITNPNTSNQEVTRYINITYNPSIPSTNDTTISFYNITLLNNDLSINTTIKSNNTINLSYYWDSFTNNLTTGNYYIKVLSTDNNTNTAYSIQLINISRNSELNVTVKLIFDNSTLTNYTLNITNELTGTIETYNTTTNITTINIIKGNNYTLKVDKIGYAIMNYTGLSFTQTFNNYTFYLYTDNSVLINIYDESTLTIINTSLVSITFSNNITSLVYTTTNGTYYKAGLTDGLWEVKFYSTNYSYRTYFITVNNRSFQNLNAYLVPSAFTSVFTIRNSLTLETLEGVSFTVERLSNSSYVIVESKFSDIGGNVQIGFLPGIEYRFILSKTGYTSKTFNLNPIIFNAYNVYLDKISSLNNTLDYGGVSVIFYPKTFYNNRANTLTFTITSPEGVLTNYNIGIQAPGGSNSTSGSNAIGETFTINFNISNATLFDRVNITYNYTSTTGGLKIYRIQYEIIGAGNVGNYTIANLKNREYGLGTFEKVLLVMVGMVIIVGFAFMLTGTAGALVIGLICLNVSVYLGFLPYWSVIIPDILGIIIIIAVSTGGRQ